MISTTLLLVMLLINILRILILATTTITIMIILTGMITAAARAEELGIVWSRGFSVQVRILPVWHSKMQGTSHRMSTRTPSSYTGVSGSRVCGLFSTEFGDAIGKEALEAEKPQARYPTKNP